MLAIQQGGKDIITYGRKKGQDMAEYAQYLQQQVNNGVIKSFEFTKDTGKLLIDNIETYIDDSYKTFLKATNQKMENDLLWAYN
ncbi:MAG: hypothetical protein LBG59_03690 [Candidatus Peribacteria bacterium]|nr:hypothetical protein [Candidatus Peribacteria bacterium]